MRWLCIRNPADTTSEPLTGNGQTGAPVKAPMSDGSRRNQGGTVEYICIPPLFRQGMGIFYALPNKPPLEGRCPEGAEGWKPSSSALCWT